MKTPSGVLPSRPRRRPRNIGPGYTYNQKSDGLSATRYFAYQHAPRKVSFTASVGF